MTPKTTKKTQQDEGPTLLRQLMGAVIGGTLALGLYYAYDYGAPTVTAWLSIPQEKYSVWKGETSQKNLKPEEIRRLAARTRNMVNRFGQESAASMEEELTQEVEIIETVSNTDADKEGGDFWKDAWEDDEGMDDDDGWEVADEDMDDMEDSSGGWEDTWDAPTWEEDASDHIADTVHTESLPDTGPGVLSLVVVSGAYVGWRKTKKQV